MAEESDLSRTEPASPRRLQQARSEGDVPRSAELTAWVVLFFALAALGWGGPTIFASLTQHFQSAFQSVADPFPADPFAPWLSLGSVLLPVLALIFVAVLIAPMLLSGWVFAPRALEFKAQRLHPLVVFQRLFSLDGVYVIAKTLLKFALIVGVVWLMLSGEWTRMWNLPLESPEQSARGAAGLLLQGLLAVVGALGVIAIVDTGWQWWRYRARHAMTWQEVLAEAKESEGSPEMRGRMLGRQQAAAQSATGLDPNSDGTYKHWSRPASGQVASTPGGGEANVMPKAIDK